MGHETLPGSGRVQQLEFEFFQPLRRPAKDDQWQRGGFTMLMSVPWDTGGPTGESMAGNRGEHATESFIQDEARGWSSASGGFTASNDEVSKEV